MGKKLQSQNEKKSKAQTHSFVSSQTLERQGRGLLQLLILLVTDACVDFFLGRDVNEKDEKKKDVHEGTCIAPQNLPFRLRSSPCTTETSAASQRLHTGRAASRCRQHLKEKQKLEQIVGQKHTHAHIAKDFLQTPTHCKAVICKGSACLVFLGNFVLGADNVLDKVDGL